MNHDIIELHPNNFEQCKNIWEKEENPSMIENFYNQLVSGDRVTFIYRINNEYIAEGSIVFKHPDTDYVIPNRRVYLSRMIVKQQYRNLGIGGKLLDHLINYAENLGYKEISLGVDTDNFNARHLYHKKGFTHVLYSGEDEYGKYVKLLRTKP